MSDIIVDKRDGTEEDFSTEKVSNSIMSAAIAVGGENIELADELADEVLDILESNGIERINASELQKLVEKTLIEEGHAATAREYILNGAGRNRMREMDSALMKSFEEITFKSQEESETKRENANIDSETSMGTMLKYGSEAAKNFNLLYLMSDDIAKAHISGDIHIHDLDFLALTETCIKDDALITLLIDNKVKVERVKDFAKYIGLYGVDKWKEVEDVKILSNGKFVTLKSIVKHDFDNKHMLRIKTPTGNLHVTDEHRVSTIKLDSNGSEMVEDVKACNIKAGDLLRVNTFNVSRYTLDELDIIDMLGTTDTELVIYNTPEVLANIKAEGNWKSLCNILHQNNARYINIREGKTKLKIQEFRKIEHLCTLKHSDLQIQHLDSDTDEVVNAVIPLTFELGNIIGLMYQCGTMIRHWRGKDGIESTFNNENTALLNQFKKHYKKVFSNAFLMDKDQRGRLEGFELSGGLQYELFRHVLGQNIGEEIDIKDWMYSANKHFINGLLAGLFDGNGVVSRNGYEAHINFSSYDLVANVQKLLLLRGITSELEETSPTRNRTPFVEDGVEVLSKRHPATYKLTFTGDLVNKLEWIDSNELNSVDLMDSNQMPYRLVEVQSVDEVEYCGYVYDMETEDHHFTVDGFNVHNCCQIPLDKLFKDGFNTGHGYLRQPGGIRAAAAQAAIAIQSNQNDQHGGQSIPMLDYYLAPYVALTYVKQIAHIAKIKFDLNKGECLDLKYKLVSYQRQHTHVMNDAAKSDLEQILIEFFEKYEIKVSKKRIQKVLKDAYDDTYDDTYQAMEAFVHNLNTMHCLPASEKIWVLDTKTNNLALMTMEALNKQFEAKRFKVISLNKKTGKAEFKFITQSQRKDNHRNLVKIVDNQGRTVRVTDNHKLMTLDGIDISEAIPKDTKYTLSPRGINFPPVKYDMCVSDYGKPRKDNDFQLDHILVTEAFAEFMGYYMGDGYIADDSEYCTINLHNKRSFDYLMGLITKAFGCNLEVEAKEKSAESPKNVDIYTIKLGKPLARMIADRFGKCDSEKKIPMEVLMTPREIQLAFLKAYSLTGGRKVLRRLEIDAHNETIQKQMFLMLTSLKIPANQGVREDENSNKIYTINLTLHDAYECGFTRHYSIRYINPKYNLQMVNDKYPEYCKEYMSYSKRRKLVYSELDELIDNNDLHDLEHLKNIFIHDIKETTPDNSGDEYVYDISVEDNENFMTEDCIYVHNSRAGAQVPFSSVNYGTDTSAEGRMVMKTLLETTWEGLGNGEIPIFPIQIFKLKAGVSYNPGDPNYDLFKLACKVSAKRLYPNFVNLDAPYNKELYIEGRPETEMATMGCVESSEIITYTIDDKLYIETFSDAYQRILGLKDVTTYSGQSEYIDVSDLNIRVKDSVHGFVKVQKFIMNRKVNNFNRIKLSDGYCLTATSDHPLPIIDRGRTFVKDVNIGDKIKVSTDNKVDGGEEFTTSFFQNDTYILGLLLADSAYSSSQICIRLGLDEMDIVTSLENHVTKLGYTLYTDEKHRGNKGNYIDCCIRGITGLKHARSELADIFGGYAKEVRRITSGMLTATREQRVRLLAGLMDADGHTTTSTQKDEVTKRSARFSLGSTNKALAITELALIRGLGYRAKFYINKYALSNLNKVRYLIEFEITDELVKEMNCKKKIDIANTVDRQIFSNVDEVEVIDIESGCYDNEVSDISFDLETESDMLDISYISSHNCRTRVGKNIYDPDKSVIPGRGNLSFTSINLPRLGILAEGNIEKFFKLLDKELELVHRQLLERFNIQCQKHPINYPFLMGQGCWLGSDYLGPHDDIREILKHGTLTVGFIGLAETLVALIGKHHGESEEAQRLGLAIVQHMRDYTDAWSADEHMNYSIIGTPAEGLSGRFVRMDRERFGVIPGVTDRDYYTNSSHVPVYYSISAFKKVDIEAPYHSIENGGHILYIEMDGDPTKNLKAFEKVVRYMHDKNAGYLALNHQLDYDSVCGYSGIINDVCPRCGRREGEPMTMEMWVKIKGYANAGNASTLGYHGNINEESDRLPNSVDTSDIDS